MAQTNRLMNWNFAVPDASNLVDPIQQGMRDYRANQQRGIENQRADEQMGMQRERFGMEREKFGDAKAQRAKQAAGNLALLTLQEGDPNKQAERWQSFLTTHPNAAGLDPKYRDPRTGPLAVLADAGMAQTYLDYRMKQQAAKNEQSRLGLAFNADSRAAADQRARMAQFQNMAPADRANAAPTLGLRQGTPEYNAFIATGQYSPSSDGIRTVKEGETLLRVPRTPGQQPEVIFGGQSNVADKEFDKTLGKGLADDFRAEVARFPATQQTLGKVNVMKQLSASIGQPGIVNSLAAGPLGRAARAVGLQPEQMASIESWTAMVSQMVPSQRPPGSGTMSDKDVDLFKESLPALAATKEGRDFILAQMEGIARYDEQRARIAQEVVTKRMTRAQAIDQMMQLPNPLAELSKNLEQYGIRVPGRAGAPPTTGGGGGGGGGGGQRYVNPQTGEVVQWNGQAYVSVGGGQSMPTADARGIPYPPASR